MSNDLPYNVGKPYSSAWSSWSHSRGTSKVDGSHVSIFSLTGSNTGEERIAAARNGVKRLQTVRHPAILSFLYSTEAEITYGSSVKVIIYIVTEPVTPLAEKIRELGLQGTQRDEYYGWGLYLIAKAVSFLNNDCKLIHGNVCLESVVVAQTLEWKLHGFDVLSEFEGNDEVSAGPILAVEDKSTMSIMLLLVAVLCFGFAVFVWCGKVVHNPSIRSAKLHTDPTSFKVVIPKKKMVLAAVRYEQYDWLVGKQYKPVELAKSDWTSIRKSPEWAIDSWGLGCLIYEIFSGLKLSKNAQLRNTASLPKSLILDYQRLLCSTPCYRLNSSKLVENFEFFQDKLVDTIHFMETLNLKDNDEKDTFFRELPTLAEQFPREIVLKKLFPLLGSALEFGLAAASALTGFLKIGSWLSAEEFNINVLPTLVKLFASDDRAIRISLLQHIDQFGESIPAQVVDEQVYPHIATGFSDTSGFLRESTLKSMLVLAPKLSQDTLSGSLFEYLLKLQVDEEPDIRTNATLQLGNLAGHLYEWTRRRDLIHAFTVRALHDTFPPARGAGIMALSATSSYYDAQDIALSILPNVVALIIDSDSDVRSKAFEAVDQFLQLVEEFQVKTNAGENTLRTSSGMSSLPGNASMLGWATGSLSIEGKPSEDTSHLPASSSAPNASDVVNANSALRGLISATSPKVASESLTVKTSCAASLIDKNPIIISDPDSGSLRMEDFFVLEEIKFPESPSPPESPLRSDSYLSLSDYEDSPCLPTRKASDDLTNPVKPFSRETEEQVLRTTSKEKQDEDEYEYEYERFHFANHEEFINSKSLWGDWEPHYICGSLSWLKEVIGNGFQSLPITSMDQNPIIFSNP